MKKHKTTYITLGVVILGLSLFLFIPPFLSDCKIKAQEKLSYEFLKSKLSYENGALIRTIPIDNPDIEVTSLLSETVGLIMLYAAHIGDQPEFDKQLDVVNDIFMSPNGLLYWLVNVPSGEQEKCSASLDDLRVAAALIVAYEKWGEKRYLDLALDLSVSMRKDNLIGEYFIEAFCWNEGGDSKSLTVDLSYLDLWAMEKLIKYDSFWKVVIKKSVAVIDKGLTPVDLYYDKYNVKYKEYGFLEKNLINNVLCAFHMAQVGLPDGGVYEFLKEEWANNNKIRASIDPINGEIMHDWENISVYAILMRLAVAKNDMRFAKKIYNKISSYQDMNENSFFYGAFVLGEAHSFDNLQTLLAFYEYREKCR